MTEVEIAQLAPSTALVVVLLVGIVALWRAYQGIMPILLSIQRSVEELVTETRSSRAALHAHDERTVERLAALKQDVTVLRDRVRRLNGGNIVPSPGGGT